MKATLLGTVASHPALSAQLMLRRKGIECDRIDLVSGAHRAVVRSLGFPAGTVPALFVEGTRLQGTRTISRALDALVPDPPLFPAEPGPRGEVERAELWGDLVLQPVARRLALAAIAREPGGLEGYLQGARTGLPPELAARLAPPFLWLARRIHGARAGSSRRDLRSLPALVDRVDALIGSGVVAGPEPNAADFQIAPSLRLLMSLDDVRPLIEPHPAGRLAMAVVAEWSGRTGRAFPAEWLSVR